MGRVHRLGQRHLSDHRVSPFLKQVITLLLTVIFGILLSLGVNAQSASQKKEKKKEKVYRVKNRARANHYANSCDILERKRSQIKNFIVPARVVGYQKKESGGAAIALAETPSIIRLLVRQALSEREGGEPLTLAPLYYSFENDHLTMSDPYPFLFALEFALQGKNVGVFAHPGAGSRGQRVVREIVAGMKQRGAADSNVLTPNPAPDSLSDEVPTVTFIVY